jgi:hypothetical protein
MRALRFGVIALGIVVVLATALLTIITRLHSSVDETFFYIAK